MTSEYSQNKTELPEIRNIIEIQFSAGLEY
jgi:hypothetical protein